MAPAAVARPGVGAEPPQDALTYVRAVKSRFQATKPQVYEAFLEVMRDFKNARSDTPEVVKRVKQLLGGHPDLLDGFNCFLPEPYKFSAVKDAAAEAANSDQPTIGGGYNLLKRIRRVYAHDERPYHAFLAILIRFRNAEFTTEQVIKNVATLFYDQPDLLHGKDGLEFFVPKSCKAPQPSQWFQWSVKTHNRFGRVSFRVAVRMLLLCEKRSRSQPPDLTKRKVRGLIGAKGANSDSEFSDSDSDSDTDSEEGKEKDPGHVDPEALPPVWDGVTELVQSEFEKMTLEITPMDDDACWEDAKAQKEENARNEEALGRGKRAKPGDVTTTSPPESPPPPDGAPRSRKSARIISKVNRGAMVTSYRHLSSGRHMNSGGKHHHGHGKSRKSLIAGMKQSGVHHSVAALSTVNPDLAPMKDAELKLVRNTKEMSLIDRSGLHKLPENCMERIIFFLAQAEGKDELTAQREALMKSLGKNR